MPFYFSINVAAIVQIFIPLDDANRLMRGLMKKVNSLKRVWIWIRRFRHRRGYGVHSPFAFQLITWVIYEKGRFYAYDELDRLRNQYSSDKINSRKVDRLLFRLANAVQPVTILDIGSPSTLSAAYLKAGCRSARWVSSSEMPVSTLGLVHFGGCTPEPELLEQFLPLTDAKSLFVIEGIYDSPAMCQWWKQLVNDSRTGITFDLYDVGLVFFDKSKIKQHYIVNF